MTRANIIAASIAALFAATGSALAAPITAAPHEATSQAQSVDYRRCWIEDGERVCRYVSEAYDDDYEDDYDDYGYGPGIVLGFGGTGGGHGHFHGGGHGGHGHRGHGGHGH